MAREIAINMVIDTKTAESGVEKVNKSLQQTEKEIDKINSKPSTFSDRIKELDAQVDSGTLSMRQLSKVIQEYQTIALAAGRESPVGRQALEQAAQLRDKMVDLQNETKRLSHDRKNFQAAMQLSSTVVASYGAAQSAMVLLGTESEKTKEVFMRLQAAQTALVSIEQIRTALEKESFLMLKLNTMWTGAQTAATNLLIKSKIGETTATGAATAATKAWGAALVATGIGAILVALGLLIANWDKVTEAVKSSVVWLQEVYYKFQNLGAGVKIAISIMFPFIGLFYAMAEALEYFGIIESKEMQRSAERRKKQLDAITKETEKKIALIQKEIDAEKKRSSEMVDSLDWEIEKKKAAGEDYSQLEKQKIQAMILTTKKQAELLEEQIRLEADAVIKKAKIIAKGNDGMAAFSKIFLEQIEKMGGAGSYVESLIGSDEELNSIKENLNQAEKELELFNIKQEKLQKDAIKKKAEDKKKANEKELADEKKHQEDLLAAQLKAIADEEAVTDAYRKRQLTNEQKEIDDLQEKLYTELELAGENNELKLLLEEEYQSNVAAIRDKYRLQEEEEEKKAEEKRKADNDKELKEKQELEYAKLGLITNTLSLSSKIAELFAGKSQKAARTAFNIKKAADISSATLDGYKAVVSTLADTPGGPVVRGIAATLVGGFAAAQIAAIAKTPFGGGGGGSVSGAVGSITSGSVGRSDIGNQTDTTTNIEQLLNGNQGQGNQPVLVTDSLAKVQNKQAKIESLATL